MASVRSQSAVPTVEILLSRFGGADTAGINVNTFLHDCLRIFPRMCRKILIGGIWGLFDLRASGSRQEVTREGRALNDIIVQRIQMMEPHARQREGLGGGREGWVD